MRTLIANFKMNLTPSETKDYLMAFLSRFDGSKIDLTLCLPYTSLGIGTLLCRDKNVRLGAQNLSDEEQGKNTGEISGAMLKDSGVDYVIIGHSGLLKGIIFPSILTKIRPFVKQMGRRGKIFSRRPQNSCERAFFLLQ